MNSEKQVWEATAVEVHTNDELHDKCTYLTQANAPRLIWQGADYPSVPEGRYLAIAVRYQGPQWVRQYSRWSMLIEFELLDDGTKVCAFYNFGKDPCAPKIANRGRYRKHWTLANGGSPRKGQEMSPEVFLEGQIYTLEIHYTRRNSDETEKQTAELYSKVTEIVSVEHCSVKW